MKLKSTSKFGLGRVFLVPLTVKFKSNAGDTVPVSLLFFSLGIV